MTTKYPYRDAEGNLVYACCVSAIGPKCQHTTEVNLNTTEVNLNTDEEN